MRLQRLEIHGFKSFSDRSELAFDRGVTAIVGPNGCGKSNVADAITWVMGEQSAKSLRGERMEDVLFNGSDARKPTASAEVRLRFAGVVKSVTAPAFTNGNGAATAHALGNGQSNGNGNGRLSGNGHGDGNGHGHGHELAGSDAHSSGDAHEHQGHNGSNGDVASGNGSLISTEAEELIQSVAREVEVTRRLYRSGESEYLIDGEVCRLRDVAELLMDTGLGAKAYAIIEQGKIGQILSSRPTDRRQLIEEAAGITKYRARRRTAELKLEAAQQNLTRIDDIVSELEKQRGTLKRQAAKARRYQKLRAELRRWEKVLFARKYRQLAQTIESARARLAEARERESAAAARLVAVESHLERLRLELVEAEGKATQTREAAHASEMTISRLQQQIAFDTEQVSSLAARRAAMEAELDALGRRREPGLAALEARREAAAAANVERDRAAAALLTESEAYEIAHREIEGLEADVEAARSEVFSAINAATALRHSLEHAAAARERLAERLSKLHVEDEDVRVQGERVDADHAAAADGLNATRAANLATARALETTESELARVRSEHESNVRAVRTREHELAGLEARLQSLEELQAARAKDGDAARAVLALANGHVGQKGAVADYLEVTPGYERAAEALLGELLQHVIVERPEQASAGFRMVRDQRAGRCGFLIANPLGAPAPEGRVEPNSASGDSGVPSGLVPLSSIIRVTGPYEAVIHGAIEQAWIAPSYEDASAASQSFNFPIATMAGDLFRGPHLVSGGVPEEARGILETAREIRDSRDRVEADRHTLSRLGEETASLDAAIASASASISALNAEHHNQEKVIVGYEAQLHRAVEDRQRIAQRREQLARERRQADEERDQLDGRQAEAQSAITRLGIDQRAADERLTEAQRTLFESREHAEELSRRAADAGASHAALVERAAALAADAQRLEEAAAELDARSAALAAERGVGERRASELEAAIADAKRQLDEAVGALEALRGELRRADDEAQSLRTQAVERETAIKLARAALDASRGTVAELDVLRATAETDRAHLAQTCIDTVQASLTDVVAEVEAEEAAGSLTLDAVAAVCADEAEEPGDEAAGQSASVDAESMELSQSDNSADAALAAVEQHALGAEEAVLRLRAKIDRLGPVNMMAIEQFDELDARHTFLATQRKDLVDSIAQTAEAIKRIDQTTRQRFSEAFLAINQNFQETFSTLFGGGRAGLTMLDELDPLESGIEIIAQPPGKRLQSVQLLSGGEKALTAISLMFALFKYKPSPFCLLDEIDAPLDDANIGRFVAMLRGMQQHTQFILITHNRKTMEIADRLYGVTMEEPGVSKLISVQVN